MLQAVLFDLYDTLAYIDIEDYKNFKAKMASQAGISAEKFTSQWKQYTRQAARGEVLTTEERVARVLRDLKVLPTKSLVRKISELEVELQERHLHLFPDTLEVLTHIKNLNLKIGLVTNTSMATGNVLDILSIRHYFDSVIFSYVIGIIKPESGIYLEACKELDVSPVECLFVGDGNDRELDGARELNMQAVMVGKKRHELVRGAQSTLFDYHIENLTGLIPIINSRSKSQQ